MKKQAIALICGAVLLIGLIIRLSIPVEGASSSIGPWPVTVSGVAGAGNFTLSSTANAYLSSGGSVATSVPCSWVQIEATTVTAKLSIGGTATMSLPTGLLPLTIPCGNLNSIQVSGSGSNIGFLYGN